MVGNGKGPAAQGGTRDVAPGCEETLASGEATEDSADTVLAEGALDATLDSSPSANATTGLDLRAGARIRQYEIIRELGRGGMGRVVLARDTVLGRKVALKFLLGSSDQFTKRFLVEARATAQVSHENIVIIHEASEFEGSPYMVLEYLEGQSLAAHLAATTVSPQRAIELMVPVVRALVRAHAHGIVHRDLKPENIFMTDAGAIKVLDFGIAKLFASEDGREPDEEQSSEATTEGALNDQLTVHGAVLGTLPYMSPEQWGAEDIDSTTDVWAVGIMLFEMIAGCHPLPSLTLAMLLHREPFPVEQVPSLSTQAAHVVPEVVELVDGCLERVSSRRTQRAETLLVALEALLDGRELEVKSAIEIAMPTTGDLVDRFLESKLRQALFGAEEELRLGRLEIEGSLGRGAMGTILSAFDPVLDRRVAIKSLLPSQSVDREQLLREARMLAKLDHRNVVSIYDVVEDAESLYLVMEQVLGGNLRDWMSEKRSWQEVVALFVQMGEGLHAAHRIDIAHCDIKPENVVVSEGRPRLIDFGLAHQRSDGPGHGGTHAYLAPERIAGGPGSAAADQYAFFTSLVEAIEGKRPGGEERWQRMPKWLDAVARRGLDPEPKRRFPDMRAAVAALQPTSPVRKVLMGVTALGVAGLAGLSLHLATRSHEASPCDGSEAKLAGVWTEETRQAMKTAFEMSGAKGAGQAWLDASESFGEYADDWVSLRTQSCVATREHEEQSEELLDFSMHCFDRRLVAMRAVTTLFSVAPNEAVIGAAGRTVRGLDGLGGCVDPKSLEASVPLPQDPDKRAQLVALQTEYEAVRNFERRGEYQEGLDFCASLMEAASALGYAPLSVKLLTTLAALQVTLGLLDEADANFQAAASAAAKARDDARAAEVWIRLMDLRVKQGRHDEALTLETVAIASAERIPENYEIQARLYNSLGGIYGAKARYPESFEAYEKALAMVLKAGADGNPALVPAITNLALAKWYTGDLIGARSDLEEALELALAEKGPDHSLVAYLRQNLADLLGRLGQSQSAEPHYREVLRIWTASLGAEHANLAYPLEQLAVLAEMRGDFRAAYEHIGEALRLREKSFGQSHELVAQALTVLADIAATEATEASLARADAAVARGLAIAEALGESGRRHVLYLWKTRALIAEARADWASALADFRQVLAMQVATHGEAHRDVAYCHVNIGRVQRRLERWNEATKSYRTAQERFDAEPGLKDVDRVSTRQALAEILLERGMHEAGIALLEEARALAGAAKLDRVYEVRFALARARHKSGDTSGAAEEVRALSAELPEGQEAIRAAIEAWQARD